MMTFGRKFGAALCCALGTALLFAFAVSVQAAEHDPPAKTGGFDDLNLERSAGAKALYRRIFVAARDVCEVSGSRDPVMRAAMLRCIDKAIDDAILHVRAPVLTTLRFGADIRLANE